MCLATAIVGRPSFKPLFSHQSFYFIHVRPGELLNEVAQSHPCVFQAHTWDANTCHFQASHGVSIVRRVRRKKPYLHPLLCQTFRHPCLCLDRWTLGLTARSADPSATLSLPAWYETWASCTHDFELHTMIKKNPSTQFHNVTCSMYQYITSHACQLSIT